MKVYLVGGAVRDRLLGLPVIERDWVVVGATADQLLSQGFQQVGRDFPVFLHPQTKEEYALARKERKHGHGYHGFVCDATSDVTLEEDLLRRDLTINAMAESESGEIVDPYGGMADLRAKKLRHVSQAFSEDPLRVLRVARFAAKLAGEGFTVAEETIMLMRQMTSSGELRCLTAERVWLELIKVLQTEHPSVFFSVLQQVGALSVVLPALSTLFMHVLPDDSGQTFGERMLARLDACRQCTDQVEILWAVICWDLGGFHEYEGSDVLQCAVERQLFVERVSRSLTVPNQVAKFAALVAGWSELIVGGASLPVGARLAVLKACDSWRQVERFELLLWCCEYCLVGEKKIDLSQWLYWQQTTLKPPKDLIDNAQRHGLSVANEVEKWRLLSLGA